MGKLKQLHIDCTPEQCLSPNPNSTVCPMWLNEPDEDTPPNAPELVGGDYDPRIDEAQE
jgi:hypothetical protein